MPNKTTEAVYSFICVYIADHGYPPSQREIACGCHLAPSTVFYHLNKLEAQGRLYREPDVPRSLYRPKG